MLHVPFVDFPAQYAEERQRVRACLDEVFARGHFVGGAEIEMLEGELAALCGTGYAVALNSGTDALLMALRVLDIGPGDEVISQANSFIASAAAIVHVGARPVFVDVGPDQNIDPGRIEAAVTDRTRAILPVHLTGRIADMEPILEIAGRHGLAVVEDAAQSIGSKLGDRPSGSFGSLGCFSAHPLKNLGASGDSGFVTTDDGELAARICRLRNHGLEDRDRALEWGYVSRLDTLQAALLRQRLEGLDQVIERRRANVALYRQRLNADHVFSPPCQETEFNTFHTFVIQVDRRDELKARLAAQGIETAIHYPLPIHFQPAAAELGYQPGDLPETERQAGRILSLPVHQYLGAIDIGSVADAVNNFFADG